MARAVPTPLTEELIARITSLWRQGHTDTEVAEAIGVAARTLRSWLSKHAWLKRVREQTREQLIPELVRSMYRSATGFVARSEKEEYDAAGDLVRTVVEKREVPPNVGAASYLLHNWAGQEYQLPRARLEVDLGANLTDLLKDAQQKLLDDGVVVEGEAVEVEALPAPRKAARPKRARAKGRGAKSGK